jgi:hypothetical protein
MKSQWTSPAVVAAFLLAYGITWWLIASQSGDHPSRWRALGVPAMQRSFDDARLLLEGVDCAKLGRDPHREPRCDWRMRLFNYPSVWLRLSHLGLSARNTNGVGVGIGIVFVIFALLSFRQSLPLAGVIGGACMISPAIMLGIERGNTDLLMFSLLVAAAMLAHAFQRFRDVILSIGVLLAACLKLYPIAALVCLVRRNRRILAVALTAAVLFGCWVWYWRDDLRLVRVTTPEFAWRSFGYKTFFISTFQYIFKPPVLTDAAGYLAPTRLSPVFEVMARLTLLLAIIVSVVFGVLARLRWSIELGVDSECQSRFLMGASIYALTFALGTNFHYRLLFLLLCIPQLVGWTINPSMSASFKRFTAALAGATLAMCWVSAAPERTLFRLPTEFVSWCLFVGLGIVITNQIMPLLEILPTPNARLNP